MKKHFNEMTSDEQVAEINDQIYHNLHAYIDRCEVPIFHNLSGEEFIAIVGKIKEMNPSDCICGECIERDMFVREDIQKVLKPLYDAIHHQKSNNL